MAIHFSIFAWRIPCIEEPGGLQSMGSQRVRHDGSDLARTCKGDKYRLFHRNEVLNCKLSSGLSSYYSGASKDISDSLCTWSFCQLQKMILGLSYSPSSCFSPREDFSTVTLLTMVGHWTLSEILPAQCSGFLPTSGLWHHNLQKASNTT